MRDSWYDRDTDDYEYDYRDSRRGQGGEIFEFITFVAFFAVVWWAVRSLMRGRTAFNDRDMEAFQHAENVRKELDAVKALVTPKTPDPDYSLTISANKKK